MKLRLSVMMFLQYAIWGAWLPLFFSFLTEHRHLSATDAGMLFSIGAIGALLAPFIAGQIADRWFATEKFLGISHILGAALVWQLARVEKYEEFVVYALLYSLVYSPTLALTNSMAFHHLPDRDRDFGKVRVWGTIGWIAAGIGIGQWLKLQWSPVDVELSARRVQEVAGMADAFKLSAILGIVLGIYCFIALPRTPPQKGKLAFAPGEALAAVFANRRLWALFLLAFPVACIHQFYFVHTAGFLGHIESLKSKADSINTIFGVGGGGLMTIGQMAEILVLALVPAIAKRWSRKTFLALGLLAYILRFAVFAYLNDQPALLIPALGLHGFCFGFVLFVAFMIVDEETSSNVRASAQGLFNLVIVGLGTIVGNLFAGKVFEHATPAGGSTDWSVLFGVPMWVAVACLAALLLIYPEGSRAPAHEPPVVAPP